MDIKARELLIKIISIAIILCIPMASANAVTKPKAAGRTAASIPNTVLSGLKAPSNSIGIDARLIPLDQDYGPYKAGQIWADPDISQAASAMQRLAADPEWAAKLGNNARQTMHTQFSPEYVGILMRKRLAAIRKREDSTCNFELNPYSS